MVRLKARRTALLLYSVLLVLPTVVLGGLHWHQLWLDHQAELAAVPESARDAARRLADGISEHVSLLLAGEDARPFQHYAEIVAPEAPLGDQLSLQRSPLPIDHPPRGLLGWFDYDQSDGYDARVRLFCARLGEDADGTPRYAARDELDGAAHEILEQTLEDGFLRRAARLGAVRTVRVPLVVAAVSRAQGADLDCLRRLSPGGEPVTVEVNYSQFHLQFHVDAGGVPRPVATRRVLMADLDPELVREVPCLEPLQHGFGLVQGVFLDARWLFQELPMWVSDRVLSGSERFLDEDAPPRHDERAEFRLAVPLVKALGFETRGDRDQDFGHVNIVIDKGEIVSRFEAQSWRFFGVAAMLALTLATGVVLLVRSVTQELEQAQQTENFVAAVTHELRTPLSTIRLHGEMLLEGWVADDEKRTEYYERIVRETSRLSTLVERVLSKSRLSAGTTTPEPADLSALVERLRPALEERGHGDLTFRLSAELPPVLLVAEGVAGILDNLIENARKYGEASPERPVEVETAERDGEVVLEVMDRGPGIPAQERERIFEAFYRVGNEATRTSTGTGLGLHLVELHAASMGGRASVHDRPGGGALFRVALRRA